MENCPKVAGSQPISTQNRYVKNVSFSRLQNPGSCDKFFPSIRVDSCQVYIPLGPSAPKTVEGNEALVRDFPTKNIITCGGSLSNTYHRILLRWNAYNLQFKMSQDFSVCQSTQDFPLKNMTRDPDHHVFQKVPGSDRAPRNAPFQFGGFWAQTPEIWGSRKWSSKWGVGKLGEDTDLTCKFWDLTPNIIWIYTFFDMYILK